MFLILIRKFDQTSNFQSRLIKKLGLITA